MKKLINKKRPFFSIVMPNYNSSRTIKKTINSVNNQSYQNFELLIIDDCSTDDSTLKILKEKKNQKIKIINLKKNGGPGRARNIGIKKSRGKYIAFLDSDDIWFKDKLMKMYDCIRKNNHDVYCHYEVFMNNNLKSHVIKNGPYVKNFYQNLLTNQNCLSTSSTIVETSFIKKNKIFFNESKNFFSVEDYDYWLKLAYNNAKFYFSKKILGAYYYDQNSISSNYEKHFLNTLNVLKFHAYKSKMFKKPKKIYEIASFRFKLNNYKYELINKKNFFVIFSLIIFLLKAPNIALNHFKKKIN